MSPRATAFRLGLPTALTLFALLTLLAFSAGGAPGALAATGTAGSGLIAGDSVVYSGNFTADARKDLYTVPVTGGTAIRLSAGLPDGFVGEYEVVGDRVIFGWYYGTQVGLYSAPLAGGAALRLHPEYASASAGTRLTFAVAGDRVVFSTPQERANVDVLYSVPAAGGTPTRLSDQFPDPVPGLAWSVARFQVSADGSTAAYTIGLNSGGLLLYSVPVTGGSTTMLNVQSETLDGNPGAFALTPDGSRVVYRTSVMTQSGQAQQLVSVTKLGDGRQELDTAAQLVFKITPDGTRAVYFRSTDPFSLGGDLYSVPLTGGATTFLGASFNREFALTPGSGDALFVPSTGGLSRIPAAGGSAETLLATGFSNLAFIRFSAGHGVFTSDDGGDTKLYSFLLAGGPAAQISDDAVSASFLGDFLLAGERAIYFAIAAGGELPQLYSVPVAGGASAKLNGAYEGGENIIQGLSAEGNNVLYGVGTRVSGQPIPYTRLLVATADGSAAPLALSFASTDPDDSSSRFTVYLPLLSR